MLATIQLETRETARTVRNVLLNGGRDCSVNDTSHCARTDNVSRPALRSGNSRVLASLPALGRAA
jgi:hypothetical protein